METRAERLLGVTVLAAVLIKTALAAFFPMTCDEAYFIQWGQYPALGYYDHPPLIGWLLSLLLSIGDSAALLRMPAILFSVAVGLGIYGVLRRYDRRSAALAGILFLVSPINMLNVLVTTDAPLLLSTFLSGVFLYRSQRSGRYADYLLSGVFLGLAFLSKYFSGLLAFAYLVFFLFSKKDRRTTAGFLLLFLASVPFGLLNLYWNYTHGWANIMFNVFNRNRDEQLSLAKFATYLGEHLFLMTPLLAYYFVRYRRTVADRIRGTDYRVFAWLFVVPMAVFLLLAFKKKVGLHWLLSFYPFFFIVAGRVLDPDALKKAVRVMFFFSAIPLAIVFSLLAVPLDMLPARLAEGNKDFAMVVMGKNPAPLVEHLSEYESGFHFATPSYADSSLMSYQYGRYFSVFGSGSHHARHDDIMTDFRRFSGDNILVLRTTPPDMKNYEPFFDRVETRHLNIDRADFYLVLGYGFRYDDYRDRVLAHVRDTYYAIPEYLPVPSSSCYFFQRYFPGELRSGTSARR